MVNAGITVTGYYFLHGPGEDHVAAGILQVVGVCWAGAEKEGGGRNSGGCQAGNGFCCNWCCSGCSPLQAKRTARTGASTARTAAAAPPHSAGRRQSSGGQVVVRVLSCSAAQIATIQGDLSRLQPL